MENIDQALDELQKKLALAEAELAQRQQYEASMRLEAELAKAWEGDLPSGDRLDYLKFLASKRFEHDPKRGALADKLGNCRDMKDFRSELESTNDVFKRSDDVKGGGAVRYITQHQFSHELPKDPKMKADFLAGRIAVRDQTVFIDDDVLNRQYWREYPSAGGCVVSVSLPAFRRWCRGQSPDLLKIRAVELMRQYTRRAILVAGSYGQAVRCIDQDAVADLVAWGASVGFPILFCDDAAGIERVTVELARYWRARASVEDHRAV